MTNFIISLIVVVSASITAFWLSGIPINMRNIAISFGCGILVALVIPFLLKT